ncbi:MAG TPA: universal stress protein [Actinospica sp.]|nr:universal stress protein [Actinospica sp.]
MTEHASRGRILVGVDPSPHAARAMAWAAREAADRGMPLHLVHALGLPAGGEGLLVPADYVAAGRAASKVLLDQLAGQARRLDPDLPITTETSEFGAAETLVTLGGQDDLIVTGTRGHGGFAGLLLGSVSLRTAAHAHCPTVVVRGTRAEEPREEIVLGVERGEDEAPIRFAFESCARLGARLTVLRAWLSAPSYAGYYLTREPATDAEQLDDVERLVAAVRSEHPDVQVMLRTVRGNAVPSLIDAARGARMIVIGAHRRRAPLSVGAGYVVQGLLSHAATPVAVVPIA